MHCHAPITSANEFRPMARRELRLRSGALAFSLASRQAALQSGATSNKAAHHTFDPRQQELTGSIEAVSHPVDGREDN